MKETPYRAKSIKDLIKISENIMTGEVVLVEMPGSGEERASEYAETIGCVLHSMGYEITLSPASGPNTFLLRRDYR